MDELIKALDKNFEGEERMRQMLINEPPKYGNDESARRREWYSDLLNFMRGHMFRTWEDSRGGHGSHSVICHRQ